MLACSTMSQMGFMVAQCGLGLFPAAIAHLFWHGMFKAYLFLSSNGAWNEKRIDLGYPPKMLNFATSLLIGIFAAVIFAIASRESLTHLDTTFFITFLAFIASSQIALSLLRNLSLKKISIATIVSFVFAAIYGLTIYSIEILLQPLNLFQPQAWSEIHSLGLALVTLLWLCKIFYKSSQKNSKLLSWIYVKALNASQPNKTTITSNRKNYRL
jgi:NAD(P)H-quinone oxidoreductase subunit 5